MLVAKGKGAQAFFSGESGGHRFQRVPSNEKRGRTQTSTVTVAVLGASISSGVTLPRKDIHFDTFAAGGPGGQHQNKTASAVRAKHLPTGITAICRNERCQHRNKARAVDILQAKVAAQVERARKGSRDAKRRDQVGKGLRGGKIRTYRVRDDRVMDHSTGKKTRLSKLRRGDWSDLK